MVRSLPDRGDDRDHLNAPRRGAPCRCGRRGMGVRRLDCRRRARRDLGAPDRRADGVVLGGAGTSGASAAAHRRLRGAGARRSVHREGRGAVGRAHLRRSDGSSGRSATRPTPRRSTTPTRRSVAAYGDPTPIAFDLEWYATGPPTPLRAVRRPRRGRFRLRAGRRGARRDRDPRRTAARAGRGPGPSVAPLDARRDRLRRRWRCPRPAPTAVFVRRSRSPTAASATSSSPPRAGPVAPPDRRKALRLGSDPRA